MKPIFLILFLFTIHCNSQVKNLNFEFKFYHNNKFRNTKKIELYLIKNNDTIKCPITKNKIKAPSDSIFDVVIVYKQKNKYLIENVDFSKLNPNSIFIVVIEKNLESFDKISNDSSELYIHEPTITLMEIKNFNQAKKICFINFDLIKIKSKHDKIHKSYVRYTIN